MSLDLTKIAPQVGGMVAKLKADSRQRQEHLDKALSVLNKAIDLAALKKKIKFSKTTWLVADIVEGLNQHYPPTALPSEFTVIATDGSHIDVDRHRTARCYLLNIGETTLRYGVSPSASLGSTPRLYSEDADLVIPPPEGVVREQTIEGNLLGIKRSVEECHRLQELLSGADSTVPALGLLDGTLILWGLETSFPDFVVEALLDRGFLPCLDEIRKLGKNRAIAIASYISFPRSTDVVNITRLVLCPHDPADCDRYCGKSKEKECDAVAGVRDRDLFAGVLGEGERSALFISPSRIQERYGEHRIYFFYLRVDEELARVEVPRWVALDNDRLDLVHTLVLDQCQRGHGYPVALSEAHEQAVVTGGDRENFWQLVESSLVEEHMPTSTSAKSQSKRTKWV